MTKESWVGDNGAGLDHNDSSAKVAAPTQRSGRQH